VPKMPTFARLVMLRKILLGLLVILLIGGAYGVYLWNKPHRTVDNKKSIAISAVELAKQFASDEKKADSTYLNKAIQVTGVVTEVDKNQDGGVEVVLQGADATSGVQCAMRDKGLNISAQQTVTIKGFCSGSDILGVSLTGCIMVTDKN
jgi:tRNA_anti-like